MHNARRGIFVCPCFTVPASVVSLPLPPAPTPSPRVSRWGKGGGGEGSDEERRRVKVFGQHGREAITTELGFNLLRVLVGEREVVEKGGPGRNDDSGGGEEVTEGEEKEGKGEGEEEKSEEVEEEKGEGGREGGGKEGSEGGIRRLKNGFLCACSALLLAGGAHFEAPQALEEWFSLCVLCSVACCWQVVPMANVNGRKKVEAGELCERRNGRGVDINRNWDCDWGVKEKDYNPLEKASGTHAFSEPEAEAIRQLAVWLRPHPLSPDVLSCSQGSSLIVEEQQF
ncbi:unnamed protein product [Closterium sp. Naga37s-1]|nr:unnamed protein product [Closterium sp. Naga37s-1]